MCERTENLSNPLEICNCPCHQEGMTVMHCCPCCELTYEKYIKDNGEVDFEKYEKLKERLDNNQT